MSKLLQRSMLLIVLALFSFNTPAWANIDVTPEEAKILIDTTPGLIIIDVRWPSDYCEGHIPGALNYTLGTGVFQYKYTDFPIDAEILIVCANTTGSELAAGILDDAGYLYVYDGGGMPAWPYEIVDCKKNY